MSELFEEFTNKYQATKTVRFKLEEYSDKKLSTPKENGELSLKDFISNLEKMEKDLFEILYIKSKYTPA